MKKILLFVLVAISTIANANPIGKNEAQKQVLQFLRSRQQANATRAKIRSNQLKMVKQCANAYYIFNNGKGQGFVIASADDRTDAILGYSDKGTFDVNNIPVQLKDLLHLYEYEIKIAARLRLNNLKTVAATRGGYNVKRSIRPLIETRWNQGAPYNDDCPMGAFERTVTGCVATAMAQVMYYHKWPQGETLDTVPGYKSPKIGKVLKTLPKTTFDWKNMLCVYDKRATKQQRAAVAKLMKYCGVSTEMDYATAKQGGSGTIAVELPYALTHYFGYSKTARYADRNRYTTKTWNNMIYDELKAGRPVLYGGVTPTGGGHEFVCDGYDMGDYFHINWGWGGLSDGYFRLSILNPDQQGIGSFEGGYTQSQCAILGVKPNEGEANKDAVNIIDMHINGVSRMSRTDVTKHFKQLRINYELFNYMLLDFKGKIGVALYQNGKMLQIVHQKDSVYEPITPKRTFYSVKLKNFGAGWLGDYQLLPVCKAQGATDWQLCPGYEKAVCNLHITEKEFSAAIINPQTIDVKLVSIDMPKEVKTGRTYTVVAKIKNNGPDFTGALSFTFDNKRTILGLSIAPNQTVEVPFTFQPDLAGKGIAYRINVWDSMLAKDIEFVGKGTVDIVEGKNVPDAKLNAYVLCTNGSSTKADELYGTRIEGKFVVTNTDTLDYDRGLLIAIVSEKRDIQMKQLDVVIPAKKTIDLPFAFDNLQTGSKYIVTLLGYEGMYQKGKAICNGAVNCKAAVVKYRADGTSMAFEPNKAIDLHDAVAVDMAGVEIKKDTKLIPSSNANCLYYLEEGSEIPAALNGMNVIIGNEADKITLSENNEIKVLRNFTAKEMVVKRLLTGNDEIGKSAWTTISLPFAPDAIKYDEQSAKLNVYRFVHQQDNKLYFNTVQGIEAYCPYLVELKEMTPGKQGVLSFYGKDVEVNKLTRSVLSADDYHCMGTIEQQTPKAAYVYNAKSCLFELTNMPKVTAFSAFVEANDTNNTNAQRALKVVLDDKTLGIERTENSLTHTYIIYNLYGMKIGEGSNTFARLPKGVYIVDGKKVVKQ